jgi:hypothetical protein
MRGGEGPEDAVERVYAGGLVMYYDGENMIAEQDLSEAPESPTLVTRDQHRWMKHATGVMDDLWPGWTIDHEHKDQGRRWPWYQMLVHPVAPMRVQIFPSYVNFKEASLPVDDREWRFWWRTVRRFAAEGCVIFEPDVSLIIATNLSASAARERYRWL